MRRLKDAYHQLLDTAPWQSTLQTEPKPSQTNGESARERAERIINCDLLMMRFIVLIFDVILLWNHSKKKERNNMCARARVCVSKSLCLTNKLLFCGFI